MGNNPNNFSAPKRNSLPTISGTQDPVSSLVNWQNQLTPVVSTALPAPTPQNFSVTSARSGLQLSWSPIPNNTSVDGFEIVRSQDGSFTDDLKVIPISGAQQSSYFDSLGGSAATVHYRIRATSGTAANPQSVRGPDSGVVSHTSIDAGDTTTKPSTKFDQFTTDATRSHARKGNYGAFSALTSSLGQTGGSGSGSGAAQNGGTTTSPIAPVIATFDKIGTGENVSANMTVGEGASIGPDTTNPGIINATEINGIPILPGEAATTVGKVPISQGDGTAIFGDPTVQGVYEDGTSVASPGTSGDLSTIQPVLVAGKNASGNMTSVPITTNGVKIDGSAVTQPISAASLPLPTGASTSANQTNGSQKSQSVDGAGNVQPAGDIPARSIQVEQTDGTNVIGTLAHPTRIDPTGTTTQPVNTAQIVGTTISVNVGSPDAGTQRVYPATQTVLSTQIANPAAGHEFKITVPAGKVWRFIAFRGSFQASNAVANRLPRFVLSESAGNGIYALGTANAITATVAANFNLVPGAPSSIVTTASWIENVVGLPSETLLGPGFSFGSATSNIDTADQWNTLWLAYQEYSL